MSYWSDLYAGDLIELTAALDEGIADSDDPFVKAHVNLPSIVPGPEDQQLPNSMDTLTRLACELIGVPNCRFFTQARQIRGDPDPYRATSGVFLMSQEWIALMSQLSDKEAATLAERWTAEILSEPRVAFVNSPQERAEAEESVTDLVAGVSDVCRVGIALSLPVVYHWTL
jgi:hypothetical protein